MKLPSFDSFENLDNLKKKIKAKDVSWDSGSISHDSSEILRQLQTVGFAENLDFKNFEICKDGTLEIEGRKVIVYIKNQYIRPGDSKDKEYKFHISNCEKLQEFQRSPRYEGRYVASIKTDTKFLVNLYSASGHKLILKDIIKDLRVCKLCLSFINYKNYRISTRSHDLQVDEFKLQEFFDLYKSTSTKSTKYTSETMPLNDYPKNWNEISNNLRVKYNYICQDSECPNRGISFSNNPGFIHVHHLNHLKSDCREENLKVLCGVCHAKIHPHMKGNLH